MRSLDVGALLVVCAVVGDAPVGRDAAPRDGGDLPRAGAGVDAGPRVDVVPAAGGAVAVVLGVEVDVDGGGSSGEGEDEVSELHFDG